MSKKQRNRVRLLFIHSLGIFVLIALWLLLIIFKSALGKLQVPALIVLVLLTVVALYLLNHLLKKGLQ